MAVGTQNEVHDTILSGELSKTSLSGPPEKLEEPEQPGAPEKLEEAEKPQETQESGELDHAVEK